MTRTDLFDVAIVGGGPAGMAAARRTLDAGLSTCIIDEQPRLGGQILRQPPTGFRVPGWQTGRIYRKARRLLADIERSADLDFRSGHSVLGVMPPRVQGGPFGLDLHALEAGGVERIEARRVVIAGGCYDMPAAFPGWTLPGVMSAGAVQTLIKGPQVRAGARVALFGTHPLMIVLARQIRAAGGEVAGVYFAQTRKELFGRALRHMPGATSTPGPLLEGVLGLAALRRARVPVHFGASVTRAEGEGALQALSLSGRSGPERVVCDVAAMCYGFLPQADLVRQAGAAVRWASGAGGWEACHDSAMRSSVPGLYVAGETAGVAGSDVAMARGHLAGIRLAQDAGALSAIEADRSARASIRELARFDHFARMLRAIADPQDFLPEPEAQTLLCRCEDVTAGQIDAAATLCMGTGGQIGASAVKLHCRAGMGLCQGRSCEHAVMRRIARAEGRALETVSGFTARYPARAVPISELLPPS